MRNQPLGKVFPCPGFLKYNWLTSLCLLHTSRENAKTTSLLVSIASIGLFVELWSYFYLSIEMSLFWTQITSLRKLCLRVLLPDGRTQVVKYKVEGENTGYIVSVKWVSSLSTLPLEPSFSHLPDVPLCRWKSKVNNFYRSGLRCIFILLSSRYQGDPTEKASDNPSSVRRRRRIRQRLWKPYAREKPAVKSSEMLKSGIEIISSSNIKVIPDPEQTETRSIPVNMASSSSQLSETENVDSMPSDLLLTTRIPQAVYDPRSEPEVNPKIVNLGASTPTTEELVEAYTEERPLEPREGLTHLENHKNPSKSILLDESTASSSTPSTVATLLNNDDSSETENMNVEGKPSFWTPIASSRTSGSVLTKNRYTDSNSPVLIPKIKAEQEDSTILRNVPIPARSSFVWQPSLSFQQRRPRLTSSFQGNARNSWGIPVVFSQQGDSRSTGSFHLKAQNSLANPGMALHIPFPPTFPLESPDHIQHPTLLTGSNFIHLPQYHARVGNSRGTSSGRRIDGRTRLRPFPQFVTSFSNIQPKRPCKRNLRKEALKTFPGPWFNLF